MTSAVPVAIRRGITLSPMQRPLWASQRRNPAAPVQNMAMLSHLGAPVDVERLVDAFATVVRASDVLSSRIVEESGVATMVPSDDAPVTEIVDLDASATVDWATDRVRAPLDATVRPYDSVVLRHVDGTASWYLCIHHVATDATSTALVFEATSEAYHGREPDIDAYRSWLAGIDPDDPRRQRAAQHWDERPAAPTGGRLYQQARRPGTASSRVPVTLDRDAVSAALSGDYRLISEELSWTALLASATSVLLHAVARLEEFSLGVPVHNRSGGERVVGTLMEVFPVDVSIRADDTLRTLHKRVAKSLMTTLRHAAPGLAPTPDHEAVINVIASRGLGSFGAIPVSHHLIDSGAVDPAHMVRVQLTANADEPVRLFLDLNDAGADTDARDRAGEHLTTILRAMADDPDTALADLDIRTPAEIEQQARWEEAPDFAVETPDIVDRLAGALAERDDVVIEDATEAVTGRELWRRVGHVAAALTAAGAGPARRVGIEMGRSVDTVVAILATLVSGGSYVPLDPAQPRARLDSLAARAGCIEVLRSLPDIPDGEPDGVVAAPGPESEAYLLFTSGSSGEPKGVPISRLGLSRYIRFAVESYTDPQRPPVAALFSALTFDLTVTSIFTPLVAGGRVVVIADEGPKGLVAVAHRPDITWLKATPSHLEILARLVDADHGIRTLVVGGEAFGANLARRLHATLPGVRIFNEYGPTEAVVGCMIHEARPDELDRRPEVPIGRPAPGVTLVVVDDAMRRVPTGAQGELCIAHVGLTAGYLDGPDADDGGPFVEIDGRRFYRSGDLVRMDDDQTLVYLGRIDDQVKVGGIRLEPLEVADALERHPAVGRAVVGLWAPKAEPPKQHCVRCGLPDNVPGTVFDDAGVCQVCHAYDAVAPIAGSWFKTRDDLAAMVDTARRRRTGDHDCLVLLSGGKDSTYALYQLVELGFRPYALTLDNGFISDGAKENVRRSVADLGIDHEFATHAAMNDIFRDSLERHSNVCHGCYKTIYTLGTTRAVELGIPMIITGLSRGQLFETRLIPQQFDADRFDPDAIDRAVLAARKAYHRADDGTNRLLDTAVFATDDVFDEVAFVDFYRYVDVELAEMLDFLENRAPWVRPTDTGRSTNCLINAAGIHTHLTEQGYHNYAEPYAWDVRLGHKTRDEAMAELDDRSDPDDVATMLGEVAYEPQPRQTLVAWIEPADPGAGVPDAAALRSFLTEWLPAHAIPAAFVTVESIPVTTNGKVDAGALPAPERVHRGGAAINVAATTEAERDVVAVWEQILGIEPIGVDDDFFTIGGDSLTALRMIVALGDRLGWAIPEDHAFVHRTPRELAAAIETPAGRHERTSVAGPIRRPPHRPPPLSIAEQSILFEHRSDPENPRYNAARLYRVEGAVDPDRFRRALGIVAERHVPLHWTYSSPRRRLDASTAVSFDAAGVVTTAASAVEEASRRQLEPFDLNSGPLLRGWLQPLDDGTTAVMVAMHHICADAGTADRFWLDIDAAYRGSDLPPIAVDYADVKAWQEASSTEADREYWLGSAGADPAALEIRRPEPPESDGHVERVAGVSAMALEACARTTRFATAFGALAAALRPYCDGDRVAVGIIASTQGNPVDEPLVGYFLNTLPLAVDCAYDDSLRVVCERAGSAIAAGLPHRNHPLARIVADRRDAGIAPPALGVMLAFEELAPAELGGLPASYGVLPSRSAVTDATFFVQVRGDEVLLALEYRGSVLGETVARRMLDDFDRALSVAVNEPSRTVDELMAPSTTRGMLAGTPLPASPPLIAHLLEHVREQPTAAAVVCDDDVMSWERLGDRSAALAQALVDAGVRRGDRVAVALPRSTDLVAAVVACHRLAAAYVPVDPTYPTERIHATIAAAGVGVALVDGRTVSVVPDGPAIVDVTAVADDTDGRRGVDVDVDVEPDDEAYVIFTSGSTGRPRGVPVTHRTLAASTAARRPAYRHQPDRFLVVSSPAFDSSVAGLFWTLDTGATLVLPSDAEAHDPDALVRLITSAAISHTLMVPTLYAALLERGADAACWPDQVIVAGEQCPAALVRRHHELRPGSALSNEYGPTECTVWSTVHHCSPSDDPVPIGPPIPGTWLAVVDEADRPRPAGVVGQLVIGGCGVVDGYLDDPDATAARFGTDRSGRRFFRTGDRAVVVDETVLFLGRNDHQLNVGGVRAEPEEIEAVLLADPAVAAAVVVARDPRGLEELVAAATPEELGSSMARAATAPDPGTALAAELRGLDPSELELVAHVEQVPGTAVDETALRRRVGRELPPGLRPRRYVTHDRLPRSPAGKVDRDAALLLAVPATPTPAAPADDGTADEAMARMVRLFGDVLGNAVDADDSFFDVGGHSLLALRLVDRIGEACGVPIGVAAVYECPTPRAMAALVGDGARGPSGATGYLLTIRAEGGRPPIFGVHVLGVDAAFYRPLAARLGPDQPVHCLGLATTLEDASAPTAVGEIASVYADELEQVAPHGPVVLTAVSLGAVVAFELASTLRARGREVLLVGLFDAGGPDLALEDRSRKLAAHVRRLRTAPLSYLHDRQTDLASRTVRRFERAELAVRRALRTELPDRVRVRGFIEANADAALHHRLAPYDGAVHVFRASIDPYGIAERDPTLGWGSVAIGRFGVVAVPGAHLSMFDEPHVEGLATALQDRIDRAIEETPVAVSRTVVEAQLRHALHQGRFAAAVEGFVRRHDLAADAAALVAEAERTLRSTADHSREAAHTVGEALRANGIDADIVDVPALAERAWITVRVPDRPDRAIAALEALGYRIQRPLSPGAWHARLQTTSEVTLIALDAYTTRVSVEWPGPDPAGPFTPRDTDLATAALPRWAWRAYWVIRPCRLAGDRLRGRRAGGELGPYLGTNNDQVAPLLALADVGPDDLVLDIGCGDGRVLIEAVRHFGCRARGVERDARLADTARRAVADAGFTDRIEIVEGDAGTVAVDGVTVAFAFLPPSTVAALLPRLLDQMAPGGRFVTHEQLAGQWPIAPTHTELVVTGAITVASVWEKR